MGGELPYRLVGMRLREFLEQPDWGEPVDEGRWESLLDPAKVSGFGPAGQAKAGEETAKGKIVPASRKSVSVGREALPEALQRRAPADDRRILQAYWEHLLEWGPELAYTAERPRAEAEFFEVMEVIYRASHGSGDVRREAAYPYASVYLLRKYLEMHPRLREGLKKAMGRGRGSVRWSVTLVLHRMQGVIDVFLRYHGYRVSRYLRAVPESPYERGVGDVQDFRVRVGIHPELLMREGDEIVPGRGEAAQAAEALGWVLWALFAYAEELGLQPPEFW